MSTQSRWNHTASWGAVRHSFCPSWAERDKRKSFQVKRVKQLLCNAKKTKTNVNGQEESHRRGCGSYNWLLVQNTSLQIALFPELSSHHQSHLQTKQGDKQNKAWCREIKGTQWRKYSMSAVELFSVLFKLHMGFHRLRSGCLLAAINMELFYWYQTE